MGAGGNGPDDIRTEADLAPARIGQYVQNGFGERVMAAWQAAEAKQNFGRLVEAARTEPQTLLRHAEPVGVVMSVEHYRTLRAQADAAFSALLLACPLEEADFDGGLGMSLGGDA